MLPFAYQVKSVAGHSLGAIEGGSHAHEIASVNGTVPSR
jgi:hypothetical protein